MQLLDRFVDVLNINDSFKKVIIMREDIAPYHNDNGILIMGLMDFLLRTNIGEIL